MCIYVYKLRYICFFAKAGVKDYIIIRKISIHLFCILKNGKVKRRLPISSNFAFVFSDRSNRFAVLPRAQLFLTSNI